MKLLIVLLLFVVATYALPDVDVVIVGAGISGTCAGRNVTDQNMTVAIFETKARIGGRVFTIRKTIDGNETLFESGANWVHTQFINDLFPELVELGVNMTVFDQADSSVWNNNGRLENINQLLHMLADTDAIWIESDACRGDNISDADAILECTAYDFDKHKIETYLQFSREQWIGNNLEYHNSLAWDTSNVTAGPDHIIPAGYDTIFNKIISKHPSFDDRIYLNARITKIDYEQGDGSALVTYRNFLGELQTIRALKRVIVTPSINVLKSGTIEFVPGLPQSHINAMNGLMCSAVNKIALYFDAAGAEFLSSPDLAHNYMFRYGQENGGGVRQTDGLTCFINWQFVTGQPMVTAFYVGDFSRYMETLTDQQSVDLMMHTLRQFIRTPHTTLPDPIAFEVTRWGQDPDIRCSYTDVFKNGTINDFTILAQPIGTFGNVYLAGEASNFPKQGTVHGACLAGQQASQF